MTNWKQFVANPATIQNKGILSFPIMRTSFKTLVYRYITSEYLVVTKAY